MFFQFKKEDVILDCEYFFSILISLSTMMAVWTEVMSFTRTGSKDGDDDEGGCHGVNGCHVVNGGGVG